MEHLGVTGQFLIISVHASRDISHTPHRTAGDRIGRKPILIPSLGVFGFSGVGIIFISDFTLILVLRPIQNAASSVIVMLTVTLLDDLFTGEQRRVLIGTNAAILAVGAASYPLLGGTLATLAWSAPFACFLLALLVTISRITLLEVPNQGRSNSSSSIRVFLTGSTPMTPSLCFTSRFSGYSSPSMAHSSLLVRSCSPTTSALISWYRPSRGITCGHDGNDRDAGQSSASSTHEFSIDYVRVRELSN